MSTEKLYILPERKDLPDATALLGDERPTSRRLPSGRKEVNPAMAFSYSVLFWGGGQLHNNQDWIGFALATLMFVFYGCIGAVIVWWDICLEYIGLFKGNLSYIYYGSLGFVVLGITTWLTSALQAYLKALTTRTSHFGGIENRVFPFLCSFVLPGWGQFLNGQLKKGALFTLISLAGYSSVAAILLGVVFWPILDSASERMAVEWVLVFAVSVLPLFALSVLVGSYDALRVSLDEVKKEPLLKRIEYANNRRRMKGWRRGVWPQVRLTMALVLALSLCLGIAYHMIPRNLYLLSIQSFSDLLAQNDLSVIPNLLSRIVHLLTS